MYERQPLTKAKPSPSDTSQPNQPSTSQINADLDGGADFENDIDDNPGDADLDGDGSAHTEDPFIAYNSDDEDQDLENVDQGPTKGKETSYSTVDERTRNFLNKAIVRSLLQLVLLMKICISRMACYVMPDM